MSNTLSKPDDKLGSFVAVYIYSKHAKGATPSDLRKVLKPKLSPSYGQDTDDRLNQALEHLVNYGIAHRKSAQNAVYLTDVGQTMVPELLRRPLFKPPPLWRSLWEVDLTALFLDLPPPPPAQNADAFPNAKGLRAAIVNQSENLGLVPYPAPKLTAHRWLWKRLLSLGAHDIAPFWNRDVTTNSIAEAIWMKTMPETKPVDQKTALNRLLALTAAKALSADDMKPDTLRIALLKRWLNAPSVLPPPA